MTSPSASRTSCVARWGHSPHRRCRPAVWLRRCHDRHHEACADLLETHPGPLIVPTLVITEVVYLLGTRLGTPAELRFLGDMASGVFDVEPVHPTDWLRIADLVRQYGDVPWAPSTPR